MVELMITISIIFLLFSMLAIAAGPMRTRARKNKTESLIQQMSLCLTQYHATTGYFPHDGLDGKTVETKEGTVLQSGAALTFALTQPLRAVKKQPDGSFKAMGEQEPVGDFKEGDLTPAYLDDPQARELLDGFGEPFHYDRLTGGREAYTRQSDGDVHLGWEDQDKIHHGDPREEVGVAVERAGAQNIGEFDIWSHGVEGHGEEEVPSDVIPNWAIPTGRADGEE